VNESDGKTGQALQIAGFRRKTAEAHPFRADASIEWIPINPVPPVVRAFNEFFFLTCKIVFSPPLALPGRCRLWGGKFVDFICSLGFVKE
jgi:hypothetical protein